MLCHCRDRSSPQFELCAEAMEVTLGHIEVADVRLGIYPAERAKPQPVVVHVALNLDVRQVAHTDAIEATANYADVVQDVREVCRSRHFDLLESLVMAVTAALLQRHKTVMGAQVRIEKIQAPVAARVAAQWARCRGVSGPWARP